VIIRLSLRGEPPSSSLLEAVWCCTSWGEPIFRISVSSDFLIISAGFDQHQAA